MLRDEISSNYVDMYGLVAPNSVTKDQRGSDNGPMFTAEYYLLLSLRNECTVQDLVDLSHLIDSCVDRDLGVLCRVPGDAGQEGPDDYYAICAVVSRYKLRIFPQLFLHTLRHSWGFLYNKVSLPVKSPGVFLPKVGDLSAMFIRQPQLVAAMLSAAGYKSIFYLPLYLYTAIIIATSCMRAPVGDTDSRRLAWLLIQATKDSFLCRLASKVWFHRLKKDYANGMRSVAEIYYQKGHPFATYFVDGE